MTIHPYRRIPYCDGKKGQIYVHPSFVLVSLSLLLYHAFMCQNNSDIVKSECNNMTIIRLNANTRVDLHKLLSCEIGSSTIHTIKTHYKWPFEDYK